MITTMDRLVYTAAFMRSTHPMWGHMTEMLKTTRIAIYRWPDWRMDTAAPCLSPRPQELWTLGEYFALCSDKGVLFERHRPLLTDALEGGPSELLPNRLEWSWDAVMVFKRDNGFDAIPLIRLMTRNQDLVWPDIQLRFTAQADGWVWGLSPVGFINNLAYGTTLRGLSDSGRARLDAAVEFGGNVILRYLGEYDKLLQSRGKWMVAPAKAARAKYGKAGKVRKLYEIAKLRHQVYVRNT